jgi:hypothetical protein
VRLVGKCDTTFESEEIDALIGLGLITTVSSEFISSTIDVGSAE